MEEAIKRLERYSAQCIAERLDPDFAEGVVDAIEYLKMIRDICKFGDSQKETDLPKDGE